MSWLSKQFSAGLASTKIPRASAIYVAGNGFEPDRDDVLMAAAGFVKKHPKITRDLLFDQSIEPILVGGSDVRQFVEVANSLVFGIMGEKHKGAYCLDTILVVPGGRHMLVVMVWEDQGGDLVCTQIPEGTKR